MKVAAVVAEILKREGVRGICLYPYNYKEVLSRKIVDPAAILSISSKDKRQDSSSTNARTGAAWTFSRRSWAWRSRRRPHSS